MCVFAPQTTLKQVRASILQLETRNRQLEGKLVDAHRDVLTRERDLAAMEEQKLQAVSDTVAVLVLSGNVSLAASGRVH